MLQNVDMLYLGASVLCMIDLSYVSRCETDLQLQSSHASGAPPSSTASPHPPLPPLRVCRFWTQFEAWLSMQTASRDGLKPATEEQRRVTILTILNGNSILGESLRSVWESKTPREAYDILSQADVTVTNQSDKAKQLPKLLALNEQVQDLMRSAEYSKGPGTPLGAYSS